MAEHLYIHIPFCIKKCLYCDFLSVPFAEGLAARYSDAIITEMRLREKEVSGNLRSIYIGGGTPTVLPSGMLEHIFGELHSRFNVTTETEITAEANPGTVDIEKAACLRKGGVNRVSVGVQSLNDMELKTLGRIHSAEDAVRAVKLLGIENFSIDLIYGIPGQSMESLKSTLSRAVELGPKHISAYELTPERGTPLTASIERGDIKMPDEELIVDMFYRAREILQSAGYRHYEISNYAMPGYECRHNVNCWRRGEYLGLGAGAHSMIGDVRRSNTGDIEKYVSFLSQGALPVEGGQKLTREDAIKETIFLTLRMEEGIDYVSLKGVYGVDLPSAASGLIADGLMEIDNRRLRLSAKGIMLYNAIVSQLMKSAFKGGLKSLSES